MTGYLPHAIAAGRSTPPSFAPRARAALAAIACLVAASIAADARALDLATLDRVSVMMSMAEVRAIAGPPAEVRAVTSELTLVTWSMDDVPGMYAAGGIFDRRDVLVAQAYVFAGSLGDQVQDRMREIGFKATTGTDGVVRLHGSDDDTGRPLVAVVEDYGDTTTVFAYEQGEYERRSAAAAVPAANAIAVAQPTEVPPQAAAAAQGNTDPAVRSALMSGIAIFGGQMKPIQKSTTLSSRSSTTRNADGSVTTRSSSVKAGVSVDPAGVANALMKLLK